MKRRIDVRDLSDVTCFPHHYLDEYDGNLTLEDPPLVLEDDALWEELKAARAHLDDLEKRVRAAATPGVQLDPVEVDLGVKMWRMTSHRSLSPHATPFAFMEWERMSDALLAHANRHTGGAMAMRYTHLVAIVRDPGMVHEVRGFNSAKDAHAYADHAGAQWSQTYVCLVMKGPLV